MKNIENEFNSGVDYGLGDSDFRKLSIDYESCKITMYLESAICYEGWRVYECNLLYTFIDAKINNICFDCVYINLYTLSGGFYRYIDNKDMYNMELSFSEVSRDLSTVSIDFSDVILKRIFDKKFIEYEIIDYEKRKNKLEKMRLDCRDICVEESLSKYQMKNSILMKLNIDYISGEITFNFNNVLFVEDGHICSLSLTFLEDDFKNFKYSAKSSFRVVSDFQCKKINYSEYVLMINLSENGDCNANISFKFSVVIIRESMQDNNLANPENIIL